MQYLGTTWKMKNDLGSFPRQTIHHSNPSLCPNNWCWRSWSWPVLWRCPFHRRDLECKVGSQEIPGITGNFGSGVQNEEGQWLTVFSREHAGHTKYPFPTTQEMTLHMDITSTQYQNQTDNIFAAKDGEALYSQQKQDQELTMTQIMSSLLQNSDLNWRK